MREQFPFLYEADCPREYKELYAQKKIALDDYLRHHNQLLQAYYNPDGSLKKQPSFGLEETFLSAKAAIDGFNENQLIYDEFNYYQDNKKVLGVHPVFRVFKLKLQIGKMREATAVKRLSNLNNYINRDGNKLKKLKDAEAVKKFTDKIELWKEERLLIKTIHDLE